MNLKNRYLPKKAELKRNADGLKYAQISSALCLAILMMLCANSHAQAQQAAAQLQAAAQPITLTADEAVELAIRNNLSLETSRVNMEASRRASNLSWNQFIPSVDIGGALMRMNKVPEAMTLDMGYFAFPPTPGSGPFMPIGGGGPQWRMSGSLSVSLNFSVAMIENMHKLRLDYEKGIITYEKAKTQLERDVRKQYHNILLLQENIALLRESYANVERQVQTAQANYNAGLVPQLTLLRAQVGRENMRPVIDQAENGLKLLMASFAMSLGMNYDTQFALVPVEENINIIQFDTADMISRAAANKLDIQELRQEILSLNSRRKSTVLSLYTPTISLSWNADPAFQGDPWKDSWFGKDSWQQQSGMFRITLGFRLNGLLPFGTERQGLKMLEEGIMTANMGLAQLVNGTEIEIYNTILSLDMIRTSMSAQAQAVSVAEQTYRASEQAYRAGLQDYSQVQSDQQALHQAQVNMLEQEFNYLNGLIDLEYAIGVPFGTLSGRRE